MQEEFCDYINLDKVEMFVIRLGYPLDNNHKVITIHNNSSIPIEFRYVLSQNAYLSFKDFTLEKISFDENNKKVVEDWTVSVPDDEINWLNYIMSSMNPNNLKGYVKSALEYTHKQIEELDENTSRL